MRDQIEHDHDHSGSPDKPNKLGVVMLVGGVMTILAIPVYLLATWMLADHLIAVMGLYAFGCLQILAWGYITGAGA